MHEHHTLTAVLVAATITALPIITLLVIAFSKSKKDVKEQSNKKDNF